jgi:hypothetical protein
MGDRLLSWFDVDGTEWPLNGESYYSWGVGSQGLYGVPVSIITQDVPLQPGTTEKYVQRLPGQPLIPLYVSASTEQELDNARRALKWAMTPSRGLGLLRHTANDGTIRDLNCRLAKGFEGDESAGVRVPGGIFLPLQFFAADPFWYDTNYQAQVFGTSGGTPLIGTGVAFLPIHLAPSGVVGGASVENQGEDVAWPLWTLNGPMTAATFTNNTTGDILTLTATLTAGQSITIDTSPGQKTVLREDGSKHFEYVSPTSTLWALAVGTNSLAVSISGSGTGTQLTLQYKQRYEGV